MPGCEKVNMYYLSDNARMFRYNCRTLEYLLSSNCIVYLSLVSSYSNFKIILSLCYFLDIS